jgi:hypothetical protein
MMMTLLWMMFDAARDITIPVQMTLKRCCSNHTATTRLQKGHGEYRRMFDTIKLAPPSVIEDANDKDGDEVIVCWILPRCGCTCGR